MNEQEYQTQGSKRCETSVCGSRFLIACCIAVAIFSGPARGQRLRGTESELPRASGLSLRVEATADGVVLRRPQDVIAHIRSLPGVYAGATDPILAVSFRADGWRRGEGSWVHEPLDCRTAGGAAHDPVPDPDARPSSEGIRGCASDRIHCRDTPLNGLSPPGAGARRRADSRCPSTPNRSRDPVSRSAGTHPGRSSSTTGAAPGRRV